MSESARLSSLADAYEAANGPLSLVARQFRERAAEAVAEQAIQEIATVQMEANDGARHGAVPAAGQSSDTGIAGAPVAAGGPGLALQQLRVVSTSAPEAGAGVPAAEGEAAGEVKKRWPVCGECETPHARSRHKNFLGVCDVKGCDCQSYTPRRRTRKNTGFDSRPSGPEGGPVVAGTEAVHLQGTQSISPTGAAASRVETAPVASLTTSNGAPPCARCLKNPAKPASAYCEACSYDNKVAMNVRCECLHWARDYGAFDEPHHRRCPKHVGPHKATDLLATAAFEVKRGDSPMADSLERAADPSFAPRCGRCDVLLPMANGAVNALLCPACAPSTAIAKCGRCGKAAEWGEDCPTCVSWRLRCGHFAKGAPPRVNGLADTHDAGDEAACETLKWQERYRDVAAPATPPAPGCYGCRAPVGFAHWSGCPVGRAMAEVTEQDCVAPPESDYVVDGVAVDGRVIDAEVAKALSAAMRDGAEGGVPQPQTLHAALRELVAGIEAACERFLREAGE